MLTPAAKPIGLIFGHDPELEELLREKFGSGMEFKTAPPANSTAFARTHHVRLAIVLWSHDALALAHRIQAQNPAIEIILERNPRGFRSSTEKNGFFALFDKARERSELIRQVEDFYLSK